MVSCFRSALGCRARVGVCAADNLGRLLLGLGRLAGLPVYFKCTWGCICSNADQSYCYAGKVYDVTDFLDGEYYIV